MLIFSFLMKVPPEMIKVVYELAKEKAPKYL